jgi:hypothetical protein
VRLFNFKRYVKKNVVSARKKSLMMNFIKIKKEKTDIIIDVKFAHQKLIKIVEIKTKIK